MSFHRAHILLHCMAFSDQRVSFNYIANIPTWRHVEIAYDRRLRIPAELIYDWTCGEAASACEL